LRMQCFYLYLRMKCLYLYLRQVGLLVAERIFCWIQKAYLYSVLILVYAIVIYYTDEQQQY